MLVVDGHALVAVHRLHLVDEVLLGLADALDLEQLLGILGPVDDGVAGGDLRAFADAIGQLGPQVDVVDVLGPVVTDDGDAAGVVLLDDADHARRAGQDRGALGRAGLEQLDDAGQAVGDVLTGDTTGVEGTHGQLRPRLADGLGGDDADRFAELDVQVGGQRAPVAGRAHAVLGLAGQDRPAHDLGDGRVVAQGGHELGLIIGVPAGSTVPSDRVTSRARPRPSMRVSRYERTFVVVRANAPDPHAAGGAAVVLADDELLGHVDQSAGQVPGVGRPQGGVGQALAGSVGGDEVLQHRQAFSERGEDRSGDHLASRVGHQALHAGDLAHLLRVTSGAGVDHHVERVEGDGVEGVLHGLPDLGVGRGPDLDLLLAPLVVGDDAPLELGSRPSGPRLRSGR